MKSKWQRYSKASGHFWPYDVNIESLQVIMHYQSYYSKPVPYINPSKISTTIISAIQKITFFTFKCLFPFLEKHTVLFTFNLVELKPKKVPYALY